MDGPTDPLTTRRQVVKTGTAAIFGSILLAGCSGSPSGKDSTETNNSGNSTGGNPTEINDPDGSNNDDPTDSDEPYSVSIAPVGEVTFDAPPETWVANNGSWADMGIALGLEPPEAVWLTSRYHTQYYDSIDGVSVDKSNMVSLYQDGVSKERFYALDGDVHIMDPNFLMNRFSGWEQSDVEDIREDIAPIFGNCIYAQHYPWHSDYRYYTLYEAFEKLAQVFQRTDRYEAFTDVHDEFQQNLAPVVPPQGERPEVAVLWGVGDQPEEFYPYIIGDGTGFKHLRQLEVRDALASTDIKDFHGSRAAIDLETLLDVDPEVLMLRGYESKSQSDFQDTVVEFLQNHQTASALTAVENDDVYRAGGLYQGPITYMVLTERTANQLYGADTELFDREQVADIVNGEF